MLVKHFNNLFVYWLGFLIVYTRTLLVSLQCEDWYHTTKPQVHAVFLTIFFSRCVVIQVTTIKSNFLRKGISCDDNSFEADCDISFINKNSSLYFTISIEFFENLEKIGMIQLI